MKFELIHLLNQELLNTLSISKKIPNSSLIQPLNNQRMKLKYRIPQT